MKKIFLILIIILFSSFGIDYVAAGEDVADGSCRYSLNYLYKGNDPNNSEVSHLFDLDPNKYKIDLIFEVYLDSESVSWHIETSEKLTILDDDTVIDDTRHRLKLMETEYSRNFYIAIKNNLITNMYEYIVPNDGEFSCPSLEVLSGNEADGTRLYTFDYDHNKVEGEEYFYVVSVETKVPSGSTEVTKEKSCGVSYAGSTCGFGEKQLSLEYNLYSSGDKEVCVIISSNTSTYSSKQCDPWDGGEITVDVPIEPYKSVLFPGDYLALVFDNLEKSSSTGTVQEACVNTFLDCGDNSGAFWGNIKVVDEDPSHGLGGAATTEEYDKVMELMELYSGVRYKKLLGDLKTPLGVHSKSKAAWSDVLAIPLRIGNNVNATLKDVEETNNLCSPDNCEEDAEYLSVQGIKNVVKYCNQVYSKYPEARNDIHGQIITRMQECISFNNFYSELVNKGIIDDFSNDCGILSKDLVEKIEWILDIIKIAGPLLAIGLGTLDFIKTVASGDADKEMKTTFKRFGIRLIAAVLLFLIPIILAFLMDLFLGNEAGYDSDNPFCVNVDWGEE